MEFSTGTRPEKLVFFRFSTSISKKFEIKVYRVFNGAHF
jgi:hypothetical protein